MGSILKDNNNNLSAEGTAPEATKLWHQRKVHVITKFIKYVIPKRCHSINRDGNVQKQDCLVCVYAMQTKSSFERKLINNAQDTTLQRNICGPFDEATYGDKKNFSWQRQHIGTRLPNHLVVLIKPSGLF